MKTIIEQHIYKWFEEYQGNMDKEEMKELYKDKLIQEEKMELVKAIEAGNKIEILDAIGDILWVKCGVVYFSCLPEEIETNLLKNIIEEAIRSLRIVTHLPKPVLRLLIREISRSNFTKTKLTQKRGLKKGKIIKGDNFIAPDLQPILELM